MLKGINILQCSNWWKFLKSANPATSYIISSMQNYINFMNEALRNATGTVTEND